MCFTNLGKVDDSARWRGWGWGCRRLGRLSSGSVLQDRAAPERERRAVGRGSCAPAIVGRMASVRDDRGGWQRDRPPVVACSALCRARSGACWRRRAAGQRRGAPAGRRQPRGVQRFICTCCKLWLISFHFINTRLIFSHYLQRKEMAGFGHSL